MLDFITNPIDFILHVDVYLAQIIQAYGPLTYLILFLIILAETGFVITPFLPGDSLLFVAGAFAAKGVLNVYLLFLLLSAAAIVGDSLNYWIGKNFGDKVLKKSRFIKQEYLDQTHAFYRKHGGKAIIFARFFPIIRTFAPFVAGIGKMDYKRFLTFNIIGGIAWVGLFVFAGYLFGNIPFVEENLTVVIFAIIIISLLPALSQTAKAFMKKVRSA